MSLIPMLFSDPFHTHRPSRIMDQHFGLGLHPEDLLAPALPHSAGALLHRPTAYYRPWRTVAAEQDAGSTVSMDKDKFQVHLDVQQFTPQEITVKLTGKNTLTIEGKHEEKEDEHGYVYRHFKRRYVIPENYDVEKVVSNLSSDGVLNITAPNVTAGEVAEHREIPINHTGLPAKIGKGEKKAQNGNGK